MNYRVPCVLWKHEPVGMSIHSSIVVKLYSSPPPTPQRGAVAVWPPIKMKMYQMHQNHFENVAIRRESFRPNQSGRVFRPSFSAVTYTKVFSNKLFADFFRFSSKFSLSPETVFDGIYFFSCAFLCSLVVSYTNFSR